MEEVNVTLIGSIVGFLGACVTAYLAYRQTVVSKQLETVQETASDQAELAKTAALAKAKEVEFKTDAETKRIDALLDAYKTLITNLQAENREQRRDMTAQAEAHRAEVLQLHNRMDLVEGTLQVCVSERNQIKIELERQRVHYEALEQQFKSSEAFHRAQKLSSVNKDETVVSSKRKTNKGGK